MVKPEYFVDEMVSGAFRAFKHEHIFEKHNNETLMVDAFFYTSPFGLLGQIADKLFLKKYMAELLVQRNLVLKSQAEEI